MKRWICLSLVFLLLAGALLAGCGGGQTPEPEATESAPAVSQYSEVIVEAVIEPAQWTELRFESGGTVAEVLAQPGDAVQAGDALVRLDPTDARLAVMEAESALVSASANLALLGAGPRTEEIASAEADLDSAQAAVSRAVAQRDQLTGGGTEADIAAAEAEVASAQAQFLLARDERDDVYARDDADEKEKQDADYRFHAAREALAAAERKLEIQRAIAGDRVGELEAGIWAAAGQRDVAQAELDLLEAGAASWEIAAAEASVAQAEVALAEAQIQLAHTEIQAPFDGVVTRIDVETGDLVSPDQVVGVLAALDRLEVHTTDLTELDVVRIAPGQPASVKVDALPGQEFAAVVRKIGLRPGEYRGDVVYAVTLDLTDAADAPLLWGMTVVVDIETD